MLGSIAQFLRFNSDTFIANLPSQFDDTTDWQPLCKAVEALSQHANSRLEKELTARFNDIPVSVQKTALEALTSYSLTFQRLRMLDVCQRILSLDALKHMTNTEDPQACATREARCTPLQTRAFKPFSSASLHADFLGKILRYFTNTVAWSYSVDLDAPPTNHWAAQSQITFLRDVISDAQWLSNTFLQFFATTKKRYSLPPSSLPL